MTDNERQSMEDVGHIYDSLMRSLPDDFDTTDILAALTLVLKDVALFHHGNLCIAPGSLDTSLSHAAGLSDIAVCHA